MHDAAPEPKKIAAAEELLVRLENEGVAVRLNLIGQPGEQPDFVVAAWVLPYVYALRGDRDWRRIPQLTGSRAVSPLAIQAYKQLELGDATVAQLKQSLGREVSEAAVVRAITELWQQLRIIPVIAAPGQPAKWQLLRLRYQKAIAEGASTSQVTAISVLASIYLQAVIAASMEEVEIFLSPLTARSKAREVLRGLVATRQVHTIAMGHAPHFYVAGTLPDFSTVAPIYAGAEVPTYSRAGFGQDVLPAEPRIPHPGVFTASAPATPRRDSAPHANGAPPRNAAPAHESAKPVRPAASRPAASRPAGARPHFSRPASRTRDRKPGASRAIQSRSGQSRSGQSANGSRFTRHGSDTRGGASRHANGSRPTAGSRWAKSTPQSGNGKRVEARSAKPGSNGARPNGVRTNGAAPRPANSANGARNGNGANTWAKRNGHAKSHAKPETGARTASRVRKNGRAELRGGRKPALTAGAKAGNSKRYGFTARPKNRTKKRG